MQTLFSSCYLPLHRTTLHPNPPQKRLAFQTPLVAKLSQVDRLDDRCRHHAELWPAFHVKGTGSITHLLRYCVRHNRSSECAFMLCCGVNPGLPQRSAFSACLLHSGDCTPQGDNGSLTSISCTLSVSVTTFPQALGFHERSENHQLGGCATRGAARDEDAPRRLRLLAAHARALGGGR